MLRKQCIICGKEFEVVNLRYCLCSDECRKIRKKMQQSSPEYRQKSNERSKKRKREKNRLNPKIIPCKICGKPVEPDFRDGCVTRKFYHESCVFSEALKAVTEGFGHNDKRIKRAHNLLGYTLNELREEVIESNEHNNI